MSDIITTNSYDDVRNDNGDRNDWDSITDSGLELSFEFSWSLLKIKGFRRLQISKEIHEFELIKNYRIYT